MRQLRAEPNGAGVLARLDRPSTLLIRPPKAGKTSPLPKATSVQSFTSYSALSDAFDTGAIHAGTKAVVLDLERWKFTPQVEQDDPLHYAQLAASLAHAHGLQLIFTPAANLTQPKGADQAAKYRAFLASDIWQAARYVDTFEIQAQQLQGSGGYAKFVKEAVAALHQVNPNVRVLAGMSTNPLGRAVPPSKMSADFEATKSLVSGYWLNVPAASGYCPTCGTARPDVAANFLSRVFAL